MRRDSKLILAVLTVSLLLGLAVSSAANRLSTSNTKFRITWQHLTATEDPNNGIARIECPVTLEGSFHSATFAKVRRALLGAVTRGIVNGERCTGGEFEPLQETLPWHLTYEGFKGTLPTITTIELLLGRYAVLAQEDSIFGVINCLFGDQGRSEENMMLGFARDTTNGRIPIASPDSSRHASLIPRPLNSEFCPGFAKFEGVGQVFLLGSSVTRIVVTLI
jgi:hypothetical protein